MVKNGLAVLAVAAVLAGCGGGATTPVPAASGAASAAASAAGGSAAGGSAAGQAITSKGPIGWNRGPYDLAGGNYELSWESDGSCTVLYFGIVGVDNGYKEQPSTAGDVPLAQLTGGSRTIQGVPAGKYYFNVSGVACKTYQATLKPA
jgi:hypothetical protein